jgi:hypothetical protein
MSSFEQSKLPIAILQHRLIKRSIAKILVYNLYSKSDEPPKVSESKAYYMSVIDKYFPEELD